jgi:hypothetical protein
MDGIIGEPRQKPSTNWAPVVPQLPRRAGHISARRIAPLTSFAYLHCPAASRKVSARLNMPQVQLVVLAAGLATARCML